MGNYKVYIHQDVLSSGPRSGLPRQNVMDFIRSLATNPHANGDFSENDESGRIVQVKIIGEYAVSFWADHAVSEVKVTHIRRADH